MGRMSLNPLKHIDPFGTILIPILLYFATSGAFLFGYAKPVPINFGRLRKPSATWPGSRWPVRLPTSSWACCDDAIYALALGRYEFFTLMAKAGMLTNLVMFAFNLFPIPPLDGGRPHQPVAHKYAYKFAQIEPYGFFIVMALVLLKVIYTWWMAPVMYGAGGAAAHYLPITLLFTEKIAVMIR
jgi:Zn-dependent protease